jgi:MinD superfamily P-loop ATPase
MKELVILSGKGGTGKTSLTGAFAAITDNRVLCDADVDAADLHLLMTPDIRQRTDFMGGGLASIDPHKCTACGLCRDLCRFGAISEAFEVDPISCEGCGVCVDLCPEQAVDFPIQTCGEWFISETRFGPMVHARLGIAQENSGKLVALIRSEAKKMAEARQLALILTDGPPGVGCPVIASLGGATAVLIVTEPTVSGVHDMARAIELANHFKVPAMICVNKFDLNRDQTKDIERRAKEWGVTMVGKIPFDPVFTKAMVQGKTVFEYDDTSAISSVIKQIWDTIMASSEMNPNTT